MGRPLPLIIDFILIVGIRLGFVVLQALLPLLVHLAICAPAQKEESNDDQDSADDGCH